MRSIPDVINVLGGSAVVAAECNFPYTTVASWKSRGAIPAREWSRLVALARYRKIADVTLQNLAELHAARPHTKIARKKRAA